MAPLIRVVGSLNIDFTTTTARFPGPGETLTAKSLHINAGGKGANQAVACGRAAFTSPAAQDISVEMVGAVGAHDPHYESLLKPMLEKSGVSCTGVAEVDGGSTGTATIIVDEGSGGENRILVVPGANHEGMQSDEKTMARVAGRGGKKPEVLVMQGEIPRETVMNILQHSPAGAIVFNPAPVFTEAISKQIMSNVNVLIVNETELVQIVGWYDAQMQAKANISTTEGIDLLAAKIREGVDGPIPLIIVTLGGKGVYYSHRDGESGTIPSVKVKTVVDTTAAGDTFVGYFAAEMARWGEVNLFQGSTVHGSTQLQDIKKAIHKANRAAALCVQRSGATQSIPWAYEVWNDDAAAE